MTVTDSDRARLAGQMHNAIAEFVRMCAADEPGLDVAQFDYRTDIARRDGSGAYPLVFKTE